jgi:phosphatidate cytidylyltransferase
MGSAAPGRVFALAMVLALLSQVGDLTESALKRANNVKDTSHLIPGHGGFMDRVDGLIFAAVAAAIYAAFVDHGNPGAALLGLR